MKLKEEVHKWIDKNWKEDPSVVKLSITKGDITNRHTWTEVVE